MNYNTMVEAVEKSVRFILDRKQDITEQDKDFIQSDRNYYENYDKFYVRIGRKFYTIDSTLTLKDAYIIMISIKGGNLPSYIYNVTNQTDSLFGDIKNVSEYCGRYIPFDYRKFYEEAIVKLRGNVRNKNAVYYKMIDIINSDYAGEKESLSILKYDLYSALNFIKKRNKDYFFTEECEELYAIEDDYSPRCCFTVIIDNNVYKIDCLTKISTATHLLSLLDNNVKINYIYNETKDVDSFVGDISYFCRKNGIDCFNEYKYLFIVKELNFVFDKDIILRKLKG